MYTSQRHKKGSDIRKEHTLWEIFTNPHLPFPVLSTDILVPTTGQLVLTTLLNNKTAMAWMFCPNRSSCCDLVPKIMVLRGGRNLWRPSGIQMGTLWVHRCIFLRGRCWLSPVSSALPRCPLTSRLLLPTHPLPHLLFCPEWSSTWPSPRAQQMSCLFY